MADDATTTTTNGNITLSLPDAQPAQDAAPAKGKTESKEAPPWERDGVEFDAERAWKLLQNKDKDIANYKAKVTEFEHAQMTEQQKLAARAEAAEKALQERETELLRHEVAAAKGVPAALLRGGTEDEMAELADQILAFWGSAPSPAPSHDGGDRGPAAPADDFGAQLRRQLGRR